MCPHLPEERDSQLAASAARRPACPESESAESYVHTKTGRGISYSKAEMRADSPTSSGGLGVVVCWTYSPLPPVRASQVSWPGDARARLRRATRRGLKGALQTTLDRADGGLRETGPKRHRGSFRPVLAGFVYIVPFSVPVSVPSTLSLCPCCVSRPPIQ